MKTPQELVASIREYTDEVDAAFIEKAYVFALNKHGTQLRESGEPYFTHPLEVAQILIHIRMDQETIAAGMLHDTLEDTDTTIEELEATFGKRVTKIVDGVTKLSEFEGMSNAVRQAANFRKLMLSATSDIRALIVKLADRLHNMRTLQYKKRWSKRQLIARETLAIYAPLADRIGLAKVKDELQNIAFKEIYPAHYDAIKFRLKELYQQEEYLIPAISEELESAIKSEGIDCKVKGRLKTPYSIWEKMKVRGMTFDQLSDILAFRVFVDTKAQCYQVIRAIHKKYPVIPGRFRDYISTPKSNGYKSLHTCIICSLGKRVEIQVRTKEMHIVDEYGMAAHWNYKTGRSENVNVDEQWLQNLANVLGEEDDVEVLLKHTKMGLHSDDVFCITPKGLILSLPDGATALDFAYHIHSDVGNHAIGAKINGTTVPLNTKIETGSKVEILTNSKSHPQFSWLSWLTTSKAKAALQKELKAFERETATTVGRSNFVDFFSQFDVKVSDDDVSEISKKFKFSHPSNLFYAIGTSGILMEQILDAYNELKKTNLRICDISAKQAPNDEEKIGIDYKSTYTAYVKKLPISGLPRLPISPTTCCKPIPGDRIYGMTNEAGEVEIHIEECPVLLKLQKEGGAKLTQLSWDDDAFKDDEVHSVKLEISLKYAPGNLAKIGKIVEQNDGKISTLRFGDKSDNIMQVHLGLEIQNISQLTRITSTISHMGFVQEIRRV